MAPEQLENLFVDDRLIEDILVYGEDDMIAAEIYPNFKYADAAGIDHIEETVAQIIKKHNEGLPSYKKIARFHLRDIPFAKTSSKKIIRSQYLEGKQKEEQEEKRFRMPENELQNQISARRSRRQRSRSMYINRKMISSRRSMMQYLPC